MLNRIIKFVLLSSSFVYSDTCVVDLDTIINQSIYTAIKCTTNTMLCTFKGIEDDDDGISKSSKRIVYQKVIPLIGKYEGNVFVEHDDCCIPSFINNEKIIIFSWNDCWRPHRFPLRLSSYNSETELKRLIKQYSLMKNGDSNGFNKLATQKEKTLLNHINLDETDSLPKSGPGTDGVGELLKELENNFKSQNSQNNLKMEK